MRREQHRAARRRRRRSRSQQARANRFRCDWPAYRPPVPSSLGVRRFENYRARRAGALHRLDAVLQRLGARGQVPRHPRRPGRGRGGAQPVRRCAPRCSKQIVAERWLHGERGGRLLPGERGGRRHRGLSPTSRAATSRARAASPAPAEAEARGPAALRARRLRRAARVAACRTGSAPSPSPPGIGLDEQVARVRGAPRRLLRDHAEGAGRPARRGAAPSACTSACGASSGATRPRSASRTTS